MHKKYSNLTHLAAAIEPDLKRFRKRNLKQLKKMDREIHELHHRYSSEIECLQCANCCKTLGPLITNADIKRMAKALNMTEVDLLNMYLKVDEDGDYVFKQMPCPFLMNDNHCIIYNNRPKACREYPHTDRARFYQIFNLSIKNAYTCPIAYEVLNNILKDKK